MCYRLAKFVVLYSFESKGHTVRESKPRCLEALRNIIFCLGEVEYCRQLLRTLLSE
jgi:hypothetical protein